MPTLPENAPQDNPLDELPWSPELVDTIARLGQLWLCHDQDDADLLLRPDAGDLPALCVPFHRLNLLTPELVKPLKNVLIIQRPDDMLGDGFYSRYHQAVKQQLEAVAWRGTVFRIELNEIVPSLPRLWSLKLEDRQRFQEELMYFRMAAIAEEITPKRRGKTSPPQELREELQKEPRPFIVHAHEVQEQPIQWLWEPYMPRGMLVMLDGDPGLGKTLMLLQVAANLSKGLPFLDQGGKPTLQADVDGPQTTLILTAEDSLPHIMIPRLKRAGADLTRIKFLQGWLGSEDEEHAFNLQKHLWVLRDAIQEWKPVLVILDPLVAYLGEIDMHRANETRPLMAAIKQLAERYACTIMGVRHPSKMDQSGPLMYRGQGNIDLIGAARSGLWVQQHPSHPETQSLLIHTKTNVGRVGRTVIFSRESGEFAWKGVSRLRESMLTGKGPDPLATLEAFFWLEEKMMPGHPYRSAALETDAEKKDISLKVLKRAKKFLGVRSFQRDGSWYCLLPSLTLLPTTTTTTTTRTTGTTGDTGTTGSTGYSDLKSKRYSDNYAEDQKTPVDPVAPEYPVDPVVIRAREGKLTRRRRRST